MEKELEARKERKVEEEEEEEEEERPENCIILPSKVGRVRQCHGECEDRMVDGNLLVLLLGSLGPSTVTLIALV